VAIVAPQSNAVFFAPAEIPISRGSGRPRWGRQKGGFYVGDRLLGSDDLAPFTFTWSNVPAGEYFLTAKAIDNDDAATVSVPVKVLVQNASARASGRQCCGNRSGSRGDQSAAGCGANTATFTVTRSGGTNIALTVYYEMGGVAKNGIDYEKLSGQVIIPEGGWSAPVTSA